MCNAQQIRRNRNGECPSRRPDIIYFSPELYGSRNYGTSVSDEDVGIYAIGFREKYRLLTAVMSPES